MEGCPTLKKYGIQKGWKEEVIHEQPRLVNRGLSNTPIDIRILNFCYD